jgi:hypothetical protein
VQVFEVDASDNKNVEINAWDMTGNHSDFIARGKYSAHYEIVALGLRTFWGR